jgi:ECF transporter S component (folate family)
MSKFQSNRRKGYETLLKATTSAMMIALSVIFCRYLGFPTSGMWRVEIGFLPILIVALLYGPVWSAVSYGLADFIGALIWTGVNPFILLCKIVFGLLLGVAFYGREKIGLPRNIIFFIVIGFTVDIMMMTPIFVFNFGYTWESALIFRLAAFSVNTALRIVLTFLTDKFLLPSIYKYTRKNRV